MTSVPFVIHYFMLPSFRNAVYSSHIVPISSHIVTIPFSTRVLVPIRSLALVIAYMLLMMHDDHDVDINVRRSTLSDS